MLPVLYLSEKFPWPVDDGGQIRAYQILRRLAAEMPVTLIALAPPRPEHEEPIRALGVEVVTFPRRRSKLRTGWYAARAAVSTRPYPLDKNYSGAVLAEVRARLAAGRLGAIHFNQIDTAQYLDRLGAERRSFHALFETQNVLSTMYRRFHETARGPLRRAYLAQQSRKMLRYEPALMQGFDCVSVCSEVERDLVREWGVERVLVVENGVDTQRFAPDGAPERAAGAPPTLVFTGALSYLPNRAGLEWFLDHVAPRLRAALPQGFRVLAVGKDPPPALLERARAGELELTGYVDDVRAPMRRGDVAVVPLWIGGGTRIKILEAMALGLPVVSTSVGAEGLAVKDGEDILLADDPEAMAAAITGLCAAPERARALGSRGRELVRRRYDWSRVTSALVDHYRALAT